MDPLLPLIDLEIMGNNRSIITIIIVNNDLVIRGNNDVVTDVINEKKWRYHYRNNR